MPQLAALFAQDMRPAEVGRALGVSKQSASRWHTAWQRDGTAALTSKGPTGVKPRLCDADLRRVEQALLEGASAHGFTGELRTLARIGQLIQRLTGVRYHPGHLWAVLHQRLGWSVQRPLRRALERDEHAIARWVAQDWPRIKQAARRRKARIAFFDESGASLLPGVRRSIRKPSTPAVRPVEELISSMGSDAAILRRWCTTTMATPCFAASGKSCSSAA